MKKIAKRFFKKVNAKLVGTKLGNDLVLKTNEIVSSIFEEEINKVLRETKIAFILGMGRSGTTFLSELLSTNIDTRSYHEVLGDRRALVDAYWSVDAARRYISCRKRIKIALRVSVTKCKVYCETNSYLRYHVDVLNEVLNAKTFHLVRDGRNVVRSMMNRKSFTFSDKEHTGQIFPKKDEDYFDEWPQMDRFERICWYWAHANEFLLKRDLPLVVFEDIISSYELFSGQVLSPLSFSISSDIWKEATNNPVNISRNDSFPDYKAWSNKKKKQFWMICGPVMERLGYSI